MYMFMELNNVCQFNEVIRTNLMSDVTGHSGHCLVTHFHCCSRGSLSFSSDISVVFLDRLVMFHH
jgi:hypothetical protein